MTCDLCDGRGWVLARENAFPDVCTFCEGRGSFSIGDVGRKLDEDPSTLLRMQDGRSHKKTVLRVLSKIQELLWPVVGEQ